MRALVTGATGFIGGELAKALAELGWEVHLLVRPNKPLATLPREFLSSPYRLFVNDLSMPAMKLTSALQGCDVVFHAAAIRDRWGTPEGAYRAVNVDATRRLLAASLAHGARRFVYLSSVGVVGYPGVDGIDESFPTLLDLPLNGHAPTSQELYHRTKAEAERVVLSASGIETVVVRPTITYGPGDRDGMVTRLIEMIAARRFVQVGSGLNHIHLTYISDLLDGILLAGTHPDACGETFILAGPRSIAVGDLAALTCSLLGIRGPEIHLSEGVGRAAARVLEGVHRLGIPRAPLLTQDKLNTLNKHRSFSYQKAGGRLGYAPCVGYEQGLANTMEWLVTERRLPPTVLPWLRRGLEGVENCWPSHSPLAASRSLR